MSLSITTSAWTLAKHTHPSPPSSLHLYRGLGSKLQRTSPSALIISSKSTPILPVRLPSHHHPKQTKQTPSTSANRPGDTNLNRDSRMAYFHIAAGQRPSFTSLSVTVAFSESLISHSNTRPTPPTAGTIHTCNRYLGRGIDRLEERRHRVELGITDSFTLRNGCTPLLRIHDGTEEFADGHT